MSLPPTGEPDPTSSSARWSWMRIKRHLEWARSQGVRRLIEEDQLDPFERIPLVARKAAWRLRHDASPNAVPVFLVGVQRSGTNMLVHGLERSPRFEVHNENDPDAFHRFRLRSDDRIRSIVTRSRHDFVLFKPLCDSHRTGTLLDGLGTPSPGRAIWAVRSVDGRARSAVAKFGDSNRRALAAIAAGQGAHLWQAQGMSEQTRALVERFDYGRMSPESASALFWYVRNLLYFEQGLDARDDVILASYESMLGAPERTMRRLHAFLGLAFDDGSISHVRGAPMRTPEPLAIDPEIRALCDLLQERLDAAEARMGSVEGT
jgi:hypothetical protein